MPADAPVCKFIFPAWLSARARWPVPYARSPDRWGGSHPRYRNPSPRRRTGWRHPERRCWYPLRPAAFPHFCGSAHAAAARRKFCCQKPQHTAGNQGKIFFFLLCQRSQRNRSGDIRSSLQILSSGIHQVKSCRL